MIDEKNNPLDRETELLLDGLDRLGRALDRERFPGAAWRKPAGRTRRTIRRILWPAVAAAAALLAVVIFHSPKPQTRQPVTCKASVETSPVERYSDAPVKWSVPTDLDLAVAPRVTFDVPQFDLTTATGYGVTGTEDPAEWSLPDLSLPAMPDEDAAG